MSAGFYKFFAGFCFAIFDVNPYTGSRMDARKG